MYLLILGLILLGLKWAGVAPVVEWSWWWVLSPFAGASLWWWYADWSGYTKRQAMKRDDAKKTERQRAQRRRLGMPSRYDSRFDK